MAYVSAINKLNTLGLPVAQRVAVIWGQDSCGVMADLGNKVLSGIKNMERGISTVLPM